MTNNKTEQILFNILRWIAILPSIILTVVLVQVFVGLIINFDWSKEPGIMLRYIAPLIYGGIGGYTSIMVGAFVAPNFKKYVALVAMILFALIFIAEFSATIMFIIKNKNRSFDSSMQHIGRVVGSLIAYIKIRSEIE